MYGSLSTTKIRVWLNICSWSFSIIRWGMLGLYPMSRQTHIDRKSYMLITSVRCSKKPSKKSEGFGCPEAKQNPNVAQSFRTWGTFSIFQLFPLTVPPRGRRPLESGRPGCECSSLSITPPGLCHFIPGFHPADLIFSDMFWASQNDNFKSWCFCSQNMDETF